MYDNDSLLVQAGRKFCEDAIQKAGEAICPECSHSGWTHGHGGCQYSLDPICPCSRKTSNEKIIRDAMEEK